MSGGDCPAVQINKHDTTEELEKRNCTCGIEECAYFDLLSQPIRSQVRAVDGMRRASRTNVYWHMCQSDKACELEGNSHATSTTHVLISPEFRIKSSTRGGTIDFLVSDKKWGLELLRGRNRLIGHMNRFKPGGQYYSMMASGRWKNTLF